MPKLTRLLALAALLLATLVLPACEETVTQENFDRIQTGMSLDEVRGIMGSDGTLDTTMGGGISAGGIMTTDVKPSNVYKWESGQKLITVTIRDGKVVDKGRDRL